MKRSYRQVFSSATVQSTHDIDNIHPHIRTPEAWWS